MKYLVCGEALIDFIETDTSAMFHAVNGGSCFNVALGLARMEQAVGFFGGLSDDMFGQQLAKGLTDNGVSNAAFRIKDKPTTLSCVSLDETGTPSYAFYGNGAADRGLDDQDLNELIKLVPNQTKFLHFGSLALVTSPTSETLAKTAAHFKDRFVNLDPNVRLSVEPDTAIWRKVIDDLIPYASSIKVSTEDLESIYGNKSPQDLAQAWLDAGVKLVCITDGGNGATAYTAATSCHAPTPAVQVADTVGAGDTFSAALLYQLGLHIDPRDFLKGASETDLKDVLSFCVNAAALTCTRVGADLPRLDELS